MKDLLYSLVFYIMSAFGISLTIISNVGVSSFNSMNMALSSLTSIKVGTITTIVNLLFLVACLALDKKRNIKDYFIIVIALLMFGYVVNFFVYNLLSQLIINNYIVRVILFMLGVIIAGIGTGQVVYYQKLKFPIENFCELLSYKTSKSFKFYRYSIDLFSVGLSLSLSIIFHLPIFVREGTIISLVLLSTVITKSRDFRKIKATNHSLKKI